MTETAELIDNDFLRQFELNVGNDMAMIRTDEFEKEFLELVFTNIKERNISVVPTSPEIAKFVKSNRKYKRMLPVGIRI